MKYKVGDKVKVRQDLIVNKLYGTMPFLKEMQVKNITVTGLTYRGDVIAENNYIYTDEMLDGLVEDTTATSDPTNAELIAAAKMLFEHCNKRAVNDDCSGCPFDNVSSDGYCGLGTPCDDWCLPHRKTRKEVLLEKFPNADMQAITDIICPRSFGISDRGVTCQSDYDDFDCEACWNAPAESEEE